MVGRRRDTAQGVQKLHQSILVLANVVLQFLWQKFVHVVTLLIVFVSGEHIPDAVGRLCTGRPAA